MKQGKASKVANVISQNKLDFLFDLHQKGITLDRDSMQLLIKNNYIKPKTQKKPKNTYTERKVESLDHKSYTQADADKRVDIIENDRIPEELANGKRHIFLDEETYDKLSQTNLFKYQGGKEITKEDWMPKDKIYHSDDFVNWINSMMYDGFSNMIRYKPFAMYCQQSDDWLDDQTSLSQFRNLEEKREYCFNELERSKENTLYFMDKYLYYKEAQNFNSGGSEKYLSKPVHKVLCFLIDCGYSLIMGKPRQIAATTTIGGIALAKLLVNRNFFIKMIAQDKEKVQEIYDDKIIYPMGELPEWMKPSVSNFRDNFLRLSKKSEKKGSREGIDSKLQVVAPSVAAINGGAPPLVLIDEAGYIRILGKMMNQARPTMFKMNRETGKLEMVRQIVVWGTGGEMDKGGKAFENEFRSILAKWEQGDFEKGIIPLFVDWTSRPGISKDFYNKEKRSATVEGPEKEKTMIEFRQTYPSIIDDMFLTSSKLLVGIDWINKNLERIRDASREFSIVKGYFEPEYDLNSPMDENSDTPYKVIGAKFVALDDMKDDMSRASVEIFDYPQRGWKNRYYQGTDPIATDNGLSNMASVMRDSYYNAPVAILNYRDPDHKYTFLQTMLFGIYYSDDKKGVPELVEANIGTGYCDYKESKGFGKSLVRKEELPDFFHGGQNMYGIDNRGMRSTFIVNKMYESLSAFGEKIYFSVVFDQLRTFTCTISDSGNEKWGVQDPRNHKDDVLYGEVFSYICQLCYPHKKPIKKEEEEKARGQRFVLKRNMDGSLSRVPEVRRIA